MGDERDALSRTLAAIADPTRREILERLIDGEATVSELAAPLPMTLAAVSKHLRVLEAAGLVTRGRSAQYRPAQLRIAPLGPALAWITGLLSEDDGTWVEIEHRFDRTAEDVWAAWTTPALFAAWFGTETVPVESVTLDVRMGGALRATMLLPDGSRREWSGEFLDVLEPSRLLLTLTDEPGSDPGPPLLVRILTEDGGTRLVLRQSSEGFDDDGVAALRAGYGAFFDAMDRVLGEHHAAGPAR